MRRANERHQGTLISCRTSRIKVTQMKSSARRVLVLFSFVLTALVSSAEQPVNAPVIPLGEVKAGQRGEVWTVFRGTQPEPFAVEVTGVIENALGPGKSLILCELTD